MQAAEAYKNVSLSEQRDELILKHLDYVRHILGKISSRLPGGVDVDNLESAGVLGLVEAARQYDVRRGVEFKTYAFPRIRGAILDELRRNSPLPQSMLKRIAEVRKATATLAQPVTPEAIVSATKLTSAEVEQCLEAMRLARPEVWEESRSPLAAVNGRREATPAAQAELSETKRILADGIEELPKPERLVVTLYYLEDLRLKEIGKVLKLSESRVSRILAKAEFRLQQYVRARGG